MEKARIKEIIQLLNSRYSKFLVNDDWEGLLNAIPAKDRGEMSEFFFDIMASKLDVLSKIESIPDGMFKGSVIQNLIIPSNVTSIGKNAFADSKIKKIHIQGDVTSIPQGCFKNCSNLTYIAFPKSVTRITGGAFDGCDSLQTIATPHRNKYSEKIRVSQSDKDFLQSKLAEPTK